MASFPSNHQNTGGWSERTQCQAKMAMRKIHSVTHVPGLSTLNNLSRIVTQPPLSFLCCLRPPSHHPSSPTSVYLVPILRWLQPSAPFWPSFADFGHQHPSGLSFSQHFSYPMPVLRTMPLIQLLLHMDTSWPLSPILYCSVHFSVLPKLYTPHHNHIWKLVMQVKYSCKLKKYCKLTLHFPLSYLQV